MAIKQQETTQNHKKPQSIKPQQSTKKSKKTLPKKKEKIPPLSQLCWNCKRAVNAEGCRCSWADREVPVKGWTAIPNIVRQSGRQPIKTYYITKCPLFIEDKPWGCDFTTTYDWLAREYGKSRTYIRDNFIKFLERYQKQHNVELPLWMFEGQPQRRKKSKKTTECEYLNEIGGQETDE